MSNILSSSTMAQLVSMMEPLKNLTTATIAKECGIASSRVRTFEKAKTEPFESPAYMVAFWECVEEFGITNASKEYDKKRKEVVKKATAKKDDRPTSGGEFGSQTAKRETRGDGVYVLTSAQNNTEVHKNFLASILKYCSFRNNAELIISRYIYNKNGFQNGVTDTGGDDIYFNSALTPFFILAEDGNDKGVELGDNMTFCNEINILPTAINPLSGFQQYTGLKDGIFPASKISHESIATLSNMDAKLLYTTGTVTLKNYIQKKGGQIAESEHNYGALVVEVENGIAHVRQIETDETGCFYDLDLYATPEKVIVQADRNERFVTAINWGDLHAEKSDTEALAVCMDMLDTLEPDYQFFHDSFDMTSRNHHNRKSGHFLMQQMINGGTVEKDLIQAANVMQMFSRSFSENVVVESNHDLALESWLDCNIYKFQTDPQNALAYLSLQTAKYNAIANRESNFNLLEHALTEYTEHGPNEWNNWRFMQVDESFVLNGIEFGMHGHIGANGSRGNPKQFRKLAMPTNTGHTHSSSIQGGKVYTAGVTGSLDMGYNKGPSSWSHAHILTYANGFRTIITQRGSNWNGGAFTSLAAQAFLDN